MNVAEISLLLAGTVTLLVLSWRISLKAGRNHGVYRFFSFESILILFLLNWRFWFVDPLAGHQIVSWILLLLSIVPVVAGYRSLRVFGKAQGQFENTQALVTSGIYRFIRHPMYASLMLLGTGICFKNLSWFVVGLGFINLCALLATALQEEKEMVVRFGEEYTRYMSVSKRFIPYIL